MNDDMNVNREINRISKNKFTNAVHLCSIYFEFHDSKLETVSSNFKFKIVIVVENRRYCYSERCVPVLSQKTYSSAASASKSSGKLPEKKYKAVYYIIEVQNYVFLIRPC